MLSRRRLLLSGLALGLSGRAALAQSYGNEGDPFAGMDAGVDTGGELFDRIVKRCHYTERDAAAAARTIVGIVQQHW